MNESALEQAALDWFRELGYEYIRGAHIAPDGESPERENYGQIVFVGRLRDVLTRIKP